MILSSHLNAKRYVLLLKKDVVESYRQSLVVAGAATVLFKTSYPVFNPLSREAVLLCLDYFVVQSLFLLGAVYFRKNHFAKTVLFLLGFSFLLLIFGAVVFRIIYGDFFEGVMPSPRLVALFEELDRSGLPANLERTFRGIEIAAKAAYWTLFAPVFWIIAYLRLREAEVKDGV